VSRRRRLTLLPAGSRAVIEAIPHAPDARNDFAALRLLPGEEIEVVGVVPLGGPLLLRTRTGVYALGREVADQVWVRM